MADDQCCQMVHLFSYQNPNSGIFWRDLEWKMSAYSIAIWYILISSGKTMSLWYVYFVVLWYIFAPFGMLYQIKSGNPADDFVERLPTKIVNIVRV
jgi:hypothetical protein